MRLAPLALLLLATSVPAPLRAAEGARPVDPAPPAGQPVKADALRVLVLNLESSEVDAGTLRTIGSLVTANLAEVPELDVVSGDDVRRMLQLQGEKESMGCKDDQSCLADIADALGAKLVVFGNVGRLGQILVVSLNLFDAVKMKGVGRAIVEARDLSELPRLLRPKLRAMIAPFLEDRGIAIADVGTTSIETEQSPGPWPWVLATAGGGLFVLGGALAGVGAAPLMSFQTSKGQLTALENEFRASGDTALLAEASTLRGDMIEQQASWNRWGLYGVDIGLPVAAAGAALFVGGIVWGLQSPAEPSETASIGGAP
jgi:hypothetical protein